MNDLNPTTVAMAGPIMAPILGLDWEQRRAEVVKGINRYREHLYNTYHRRKLFDAAFHCFVPQSFPNDCTGSSKCTGCFSGVTLPPEISGVVAAWQCGASLRLRSRWREAFTGKYQCSSEMGLVMLPQNFPTERHLKSPARLRFFAENHNDHGKTVFMEARMRSGEKRLRFDLKVDEWVQTEDPVHEVFSVSLPDGLTGAVTLATEDNYELSVYAPWERAPSYQRVKFLTPCQHNVLIQGTRRFTPVWFDPDIVEVGSTTVMEFYAQYLRYSRSKDVKDRQTGADALAQAEDQLNGLMARAMAGAIQDGPRKGVRPSRALPGYNFSHRRP